MSLSLKFAIEAEVQQNHVTTTAHSTIVELSTILEEQLRIMQLFTRWPLPLLPAEREQRLRCGGAAPALQ